MKNRTVALMGAVAACLTLAAAPTVRAQDVAFTPQMVMDRAEIDDLLERYYANFGKAEGEAFGSFYAEDAEFVLGGKSDKGREAIAGVYKGISGGAQNPTNTILSTALRNATLNFGHGADHLGADEEAA